jgi:hypothetical protein
VIGNKDTLEVTNVRRQKWVITAAQ